MNGKVSSGITLLSVGSTAPVSDIYDQLVLVNSEGTHNLDIFSSANMQLRKVDHSETVYTLVFEYMFSMEGISYISRDNPNSQDDQSKFLIQADYLLKDLPFLLQTFTVDTKLEEFTPIKEEVDKLQFKNGLLVNLTKFSDLLGVIHTQKDLVAQSSFAETHQFIEFFLPEDFIKLHEISLSMENTGFIEFLGSETAKFNLSQLEPDNIENLLKNIDKEIGQDIKSEILKNFEKDSAEFNQMKQKLIENKLKFSDKEEVTLESSLVTLYETNWKDLFKNKLLIFNLEEINNFLSISLSSNVIFSGAMFYLNKFLFQSQRVAHNPIEILDKLLADDSEMEQKDVLLSVLKELYDNLFSHFKNNIDYSKFLIEHSQIFTEYKERVKIYLQLIEFQGDMDGILQVIQEYADTYNEDIDVFIYLNSKIKQILNKFIEYVESKTPNLLLKENSKELIKHYFCFYTNEDDTDNFLNYKPIEGIYFKFPDRKKLLIA
jgi:hypothetical protein